MTTHGGIKRGATRRVVRGELRERTDGKMALTPAYMMTLGTVAGTLVWQILGHSDVMVAPPRVVAVPGHPLFGLAW